MSSDQATDALCISLIVTDRSGEQTSVIANTGEPLMYALRDAELGIEASCGGGGICATCHIYLDDGWLDLVPAPDVFEEMQLEGLIHRIEKSRLACQIPVCARMASKSLTIAPEEL